MKRYRTLFMALLLLAGALSFNNAQDNDTGLSEDTPNSGLEVYVDESELQILEHLAAGGSSIARAEWEELLLLLLNGDITPGQAEEYLTQDSSGAYDLFKNFLVDYFFEQLDSADLGDLMGRVKEANYTYLYAMEEDGKKIKRDSEGDPVIQDTGDWEDDRDKWEELVRAKKQELLDKWIDSANTIPPSLLALLPDDTQNELVSLCSMRLKDYQKGVESELNLVMMTEERAFLNLRRYDKYSLYKHSQSQTAEAIGQGLLEEASAFTEAGLKRLHQGLDDASGRADADEVSLRSADWLKEYEKELEIGLSKWQDAEKQLLLNRANWSEQAARDLQEGEQAWALAYKRLKDAWMSWENEMTANLQLAISMLDKKGNDLQANIKSATDQLELAKQERVGAVNEQVTNLLDMYLQSASMLSTANDSLDLWKDELKKVTGISEAVLNNYLTAYDPDTKYESSSFGQWIAGKSQEYADLSAPIKACITVDASGSSEFLQQYNYVQSLVNQFESAKVENLNSIKNTLDNAVAVLMGMAQGRGMSGSEQSDKKRQYTTSHMEEHGNVTTNHEVKISYPNATWYANTLKYLEGLVDKYAQKSKDTEFYGGEIAYWHKIQHEYSTYQTHTLEQLNSMYGLAEGEIVQALGVLDVNGEISKDNIARIVLDEYQLELLAAKGEANYWAKQVEIAQAVYDYAIDNSSNKPTAAETQAAYGAALQTLTDAEAAYQVAVDALAGCEKNLAASKTALAEAKKALMDKRTLLEQAEAKFESMYSMLLTSGDEFYKERIQDYYRQLLNVMGMGESQADTLSQAMTDYLGAARRNGVAQMIYANADELNTLVQGSGNDLESISALQGKIDKLAGLSWNGLQGEGNTESYLTDCGVSANSTWYGVISAEYEQYKILAAGSDESAQDAQKVKIELLIECVKQEAQRKLEERIEAIRLLTSETLVDWTGGLENFKTQGKEILVALESQAKEADVKYLSSKVGLLEGALEKFKYMDDDGLDDFRESYKVPDKVDKGNRAEYLAYLFAREYGENTIKAASDWRDAQGALAGVLKSIIDDPTAYDLVSRKEDLKALCASNPLARELLTSGANVFSGFDYTELLLGEEAEQREQALSRYGLLERYRDVSPCLRQEAMNGAMSELREWLNIADLLDESTGADEYVLEDPADVWQKITEGVSVEDRGTALSQYLEGIEDKIRDLPSILPDYVVDTFYAYFNELSGYFACQLLLEEQEGAGDLVIWHQEKKQTLTKEIEDLEADDDKFTGRLQELDEVYKIVAGGNELYGLLALYEDLTLESSYQSLEGMSPEWQEALTFTLQQVEERIIRSASVELALEAQYDFTQNGGKEPDWDVLADGLDTGEQSLTVVMKQEIIAQAKKLYRQQGLLALGLTTDWSSMSALDPEDELIYKTALWGEYGAKGFYDMGVGMDELGHIYELYMNDPNGLKELIGYTPADSECINAIKERLGVDDLSLINDMGPGAEVYRFSLALAAGQELVNSNKTVDEAETILTWLMELYGLGYDQGMTKELSSLSGSETEEQVLYRAFSNSIGGCEFYLKSLVLGGGDYQAALNGDSIDQDFAAELAGLKERINILGSFVPVLDGQALDYAVEAKAGNALEVSRLLSALQSGAWDDPIFYARFVGGLDYLNARETCERGVSASLLGLYMRLIQAESGEVVGTQNRVGTELMWAHIQNDIVERWLSRADIYQTVNEVNGVLVKPGFNYRLALIEINLEVDEQGSSETEPLTSTEVSSYMVVDGSDADADGDPVNNNDIFHLSRGQDKSGYRNELLERYNNIMRLRRDFEYSVELAKNEYEEEASTMLAAYLTQTSSLLDSNITVEMNNILAYGDNLYAIELAEKEDQYSILSNLERKIANFKEGICTSAEAYEAVVASFDKDNYMDTVLAEQQKKIDEYKIAIEGTVEDETDGLMGLYLTALNAFDKSHGLWMDAQNNLDEKYNAMEAARHNLKINEAIVEYAKSLYLATGVEGGTVIVDPDDRLQYAEQQFDRATRIFEGLRDMFAVNGVREDITVQNDDLNNAYNDYAKSYRDYLWLEEAVGLLSSSIDEQERLVEECKYDEEMAFSFIKNSAFFDDGNEEYYNNEGKIDGFMTILRWIGRFDLPEEGSWLGNIVYDRGHNYVPSDQEAQKIYKEKLNDYFNNPEGFEQDFKDWAKIIGDIYKSDKDFFDYMLNKGGTLEKAYVYLMAMEYSGGDPFSTVTIYNPATYTTTVQEVVKGKILDSDTFKKMVAPYDYSQKRYHDSLSELIFAGRDEWARISSNTSSTEYKLLNFFILLNKVGALCEEGTIKLGHYTHHSQFLLWKWKKTIYYNEFKGATFADYTTQRSYLDKEEAILNNMLGNEEDGNETVDQADTIRVALQNAFRVNGKNKNGFTVAVVDAGNLSLLTEYFNLLNGVDEREGNVLDVLENMRDKARDNKIATKSTLDALLQTKLGIHGSETDQDDTEWGKYNTALASLKSTSNEADFETRLDAYLNQARATFLEGSYSAKDEYLRYYNIYKTILYSEGTEANILGNVSYSNPLFPLDPFGEGTVSSIMNNITYSNPIFPIVQNIMNEERGMIQKLYAERLDKYISLQNREWNLTVADFERQKKDILDMMQTLKERGTREFQQAEEDLREAREAWLVNFEEEYKAKEGQWNDAYTGFAEDMKAWVIRAEDEVVNVGPESILASFGDPKGAAKVEGIINSITRISLEKPDSEQVVDSIVGESTKSMLDFSRFQLKSIDMIGTEVASTLTGKSIVNTGMNMRIAEFQLKDKEDIKEHSSYVTAQMALNSLEEAIEGMEEQINIANKRVEMNIDHTMSNSGYDKRGSDYLRQVITDSSLLGGDEYKTQTITTYRFYDAPEFEIGVDLHPQSVTGLTGEAINCLVAKGMRSLQKQMEDIFGKEEEEEEANNSAEYAEANAAAEDDELDGFFNIWVGKAPLLIEPPNPSKSINKNIKEAGIGEMGRIFTDFYAQEFKRQIGEAKAEAPFFSKPLWGGKIFGFKAPSLKDVVNIGVSIVTAASGVGVIASALLNTVDDAVFTMANVATGNMTWDEGLFSIAQAGVGSVVSAQIGDWFSVGKIADPSCIEDVIANTIGAGMEKAATNLTVGAINAVQYRSGGEFGFNMSQYVHGLVGKEALVSYAGTMAGEFAQSGLNAIYLGKGIKNQEGNIVSYEKTAGWIAGQGTKIGSIQNLTGTIGNLVNAGIDFGFTGDTTINILNARDFIPGFQGSVGLFELTIDSERGVSGNIGMGGIDLSLGRIADSFRGIAALNLNAKVIDTSQNKVTGDVSAAQKAFMLRSNMDLGDEEAQATVWNILAGIDTLDVSSEMKEGKEGLTTYNEKSKGRNINVLGTKSEKIADWLAGTYTLQHEAYRSGIVEEDNKLETREATKSHIEMIMKLAGVYGSGWMNEAEKKDVMAYAMAKETGINKIFDKYVDEFYSSEKDYLWRMKEKNGEIWLEWDQSDPKYDVVLLNNRRLEVGGNNQEWNTQQFLNMMGLKSMQGIGWQGSLKMNVTDAFWSMSNISDQEKRSMLENIGLAKVNYKLFVGYHEDEILSDVAVSLIKNNFDYTKSYKDLISNYTNMLTSTSSDISKIKENARFNELYKSMITFCLNPKDIVSSNNFTITCGQGPRTQPKNDFHYGIDVAGINNANVMSLLGGKIYSKQTTNITYFEGTKEEFQDYYNCLDRELKLYWNDVNTDKPYHYDLDKVYGNNVVVEHGFYFQDGNQKQFVSAGFFTHYSHLAGNNFSNINVGDSINAGTILDKVGDTGCSSNQHLDFEIYSLGRTYNKYLSIIFRNMQVNIPSGYPNYYYDFSSLFNSF